MSSPLRKWGGSRFPLLPAARCSRRGLRPRPPTLGLPRRRCCRPIRTPPSLPTTTWRQHCRQSLRQLLSSRPLCRPVLGHRALLWPMLQQPRLRRWKLLCRQSQRRRRRCRRRSCRQPGTSLTTPPALPLGMALGKGSHSRALRQKRQFACRPQPPVILRLIPERPWRRRQQRQRQRQLLVAQRAKRAGRSGR